MILKLIRFLIVLKICYSCTIVCFDCNPYCYEATDAISMTLVNKTVVNEGWNHWANLYFELDQGNNTSFETSPLNCTINRSYYHGEIFFNVINPMVVGQKYPIVFRNEECNLMTFYHVKNNCDFYYINTSPCDAENSGYKLLSMFTIVGIVILTVASVSI